jgi:hypothetical protein
MARAIARIGREKRIRTLAQNLYVIEGANKAADLRRAERALLRENPALADAAAFRPGAAVLVPADLGLATSDRVEKPRPDLDGLLLEATVRLQMSETVLREGFARSREGAKLGLERLQDQRFVRALAKAAPATAKLVPSAHKNLEEQMAEAEKREAEVAEAIRAAIADIDHLRRLARKKP